jgi:caa(3)-type oxidase subunit IV
MTERESHASSAKYVAALVALLALTALSFGLGRFARLGAAGPFIAFSIAGIKVIIVGLIFMELRDSLPATRLVAVVTVLFVALLCLGILADVAFR